MGEPISPDDFERAWRIVSHRAPEAVDLVVPVEVLARVVEALDALEARLAEQVETREAA
jgi:hypothetical protein